MLYRNVGLRNAVHFSAMAAAIVLLAACGVGTDVANRGEGGVSADSSQSAVVMDQSAVAKDQSRWALPSDPYHPASFSNIEMHAYELRHLRCMKERGVDELRPRLNLAAPPSETLAADGISEVFNEDLAAKYGYRRAPNPQDTYEDEILRSGDEWILGSKTGEFHEVFELCHEEVQNEFLSSSAFANEEEGTDLLAQFDQLRVDFNASDLIEPAALWRECMTTVGIADLPETPWAPGTLPESLRDRWNWSSTGEPSEEEVAVATSDAACRRSSGWFDALYDAEWKLHETFVKEHHEELDALRRKFEADEERYRAIIAEETRAS